MNRSSRTDAPVAEPTEGTSFRYRVSGMDCAKDAARIERAAQSAGLLASAVKVSAATHIMTVSVPHARLSEIERAVAKTGYGFERLQDGEDSSPSAAIRNLPIIAPYGSS